jgi:uracil-DNA glycosylase
MWYEFLKDQGLDNESIDLTGSFFVGDAGGRQANAQAGSGKDHACSDRSVPFYATVPRGGHPVEALAAREDCRELIPLLPQRFRFKRGNFISHT